MANIPLFTAGDDHSLNRRSFIAASSSLGAAAFWSSCSLRAASRSSKVSEYPFQLGVASGDPDSFSVVLWTRLARRPLDGGGMPQLPVEVSWQIAEDERMARIVQKGTVTARPEWAHSVHVEANRLRPDRWYWYQFKAALN